MKNKAPEPESVPGWTAANGIIVNCAVCKVYLPGDVPAYWRETKKFNNNGATVVKTKIVCRSCADIG